MKWTVAARLGAALAIWLIAMVAVVLVFGTLKVIVKLWSLFF